MYECIGKQTVNFKNKNGEDVTLVKIFANYEEKNIDGFGCEVFNVNPVKSSLIEIGDSFEPLYNKFGKVQELRRIE